MAGGLGTITLAAHACAYNLIPIAFMVPLGISIGANVRIGTLLAEGKPNHARKIAFLAVFLYGGAAVVYCGVIFVCGKAWVAMFTMDQNVRDLADEIWPWVIVDLFVDGLFGVQSGVMRGLGMQLRCSIAVIAALWVFGLPFTYWGGYTQGWGLRGIWATLPFAYAFVNVLLFLCWTVFADWSQMSEDLIKGGDGAGPAKDEGEVSSVGVSVEDSTCSGNGKSQYQPVVQKGMC